ncbi:hypothetical protein GALMADRAFT_237878 [Galerina marginata CBS 339.88]|uniref:NADP-dependent oxidoreductase domain-containing protein n=1 Tax=Galerina marginata (strain CBS 339.88) TaxID=685588 RepID=A0A067THD1_GALM3|nr:hypothetical protein GALMADRAFT_237878 [Galerina marginata CBS 339.88]
MAPVTHHYEKVPYSSSQEEPTDYYLAYHIAEAHSSEQVIERQPRKKRLGRAHFIFIALFIVSYMVFFIARGSFASTRVAAGMRQKCRETMHRFGLAGHGMHRNMSTATGAKLPTHYTLPSGDKIPAVALGVWRAGRGEVGEAIKAALKLGYRHIDGAWIYGNEAEVGQAIRESGIPRKDLWLTSKLWNTFHAPEDVEPALDESLARLGTDYLDLYLIHWPVAFKKGGNNDVDFELTENPYPTWQKLEEMVEKGKVRNIGISNFNIRRIQNLTANPLKVKPAVNQVELSYWNPQPELLQWSKENGLLLEAYSPLGSAEKVKESLDVAEAKEIAKDLGITPAQLYISWHVQRGTIVLPKSVNSARIEENFGVVALPDSAIQRLEIAATSHKPLRTVDPSKNWGVDIWN